MTKKHQIIDHGYDNVGNVPGAWIGCRQDNRIIGMGYNKESAYENLEENMRPVDSDIYLDMTSPVYDPENHEHNREPDTDEYYFMFLEIIS